MMRSIRFLVLIAAVTLTPKLAGAMSLQLGFGAHYWVDTSAVFDLNLAPGVRLGRRVTLGGRFGVALATSPSVIGIPVDLFVRGEFSRFYVEGLVGPWIWFVEERPVHAHVGVGFGMRTSFVNFGLEAGYMDPNGMIGVRVAIPL
jgi:hypothetical protein